MSVLLANIAASLGTLNAAMLFHKLMLINILHLPSSFYDVTPTGRILARFSNDVDVLDTRLPSLIRSLLPSLFRVSNTSSIILFIGDSFVTWFCANVVRWRCACQTLRRPYSVSLCKFCWVYVCVGIKWNAACKKFAISKYKC